MAKKPQTPWFTIVYGVYNSIFLFFIYLMSFIMIFASGFLLSYIEENEDFNNAFEGADIGADIVGGMFIFIGMIPLAIAALSTFFLVKMFQGRKWAVIVLLILDSMAMLLALVSFNIFSMITIPLQLVALGFMIADPYFNQDEISEESETKEQSKEEVTQEKENTVQVETSETAENKA